MAEPSLSTEPFNYLQKAFSFPITSHFCTTYGGRVQCNALKRRCSALLRQLSLRYSRHQTFGLRF